MKVTPTRDGSLTMHCPSVGEDYHSHAGARFEAQQLYVVASGLEAALGQRSLSILDVGLGLGYNALSTLDAWHRHAKPRNVSIVSLEKDSELVSLLTTGRAPWQQNWPEAWTQNARAIAGRTATFDHPSGAQLHWRLEIGDASNLGLGKQRFDFIYQDPFSPAKNPSLWTRQWFARLHDHAHVGCTLVTYSVAALVRHNLSAAGWDWQRIPGRGGTKRHWLKAYVANKA